MSYYYVELDQNSVVKATLETYAPIIKSTMISVDQIRNDLLGWKYENEQFSPPPPPPEPKEG